MRKEHDHYDLVVFGGGFFGIYAAIHYKSEGLRVAIVEREKEIWSKASLVNQARVHTGYHYPRSMKTAAMANDHRQRFMREHDFAINKKFDKFYAIDNRGSLTTADQFERFSRKVSIPYSRISRPDLINEDLIEALFLTEEYSFDPILLREHYRGKILEMEIDLLTDVEIDSVEKSERKWQISLSSDEKEQFLVSTDAVINATYANINAVLGKFDLPTIPVTHEISELVLLTSNKLRDIGLTVMDGPFISLMPFGNSGYHSLSSVLYTHKAYSRTSNPSFYCQDDRQSCTPIHARACQSCMFKPETNKRKMIAQAKQYFNESVDWNIHGSLVTIKTKLESSFIDDGRPTDIRVASREPFFATIFSGKINSIYEIEGLKLDA